MECHPADEAQSAADLMFADCTESSLKQYYRKSAAKRNSTYTIAMEEIKELHCRSEYRGDGGGSQRIGSPSGMFFGWADRENRVIFMRRYWFSASYEEIARITGLKEKAVSVRLSRIGGSLKEYLISNGETAVRWL